MKNNRLIIRFIAILLISTVLCFAAVYGARFATQYDLAQIAYILLIFFPVIAALIGAMCGIYLQRIWMSPIISLLAFLTTMLVSFRNANYLYLIIYMIISVVGYMVAHAIKGFTEGKTK